LSRQAVLEANPADGLRCPRQDKRLPHFMSAADVERLVQAPEPETPLGVRDRALLETIYSAGLRVSESVGLDLDDVDFDSGLATIRGKGKRERLALLGPQAVQAVKHWLKARDIVTGSRPQAAVFVNKHGTRLTTRSVGR